MKKSILKVFLITVIIFGLVFVSIVHSVSNLPSTKSASMTPSIIWSRTYVESNLESVWIVIQAADGGFLLGGLRPPNNSTPGIGLLKVDSLGNPIWNKTYLGATGIFGKWLIQTSDGGYAFAGQQAGSCLLVKVDNEGNMQWNQTYNGTGIGAASAIAQTEDCGYVVTGNSRIPTENGTSFIWLFKTDVLGNEQWNSTLGEGDADSVIQTSDDGYALTRHTTKLLLSKGEIENDCWLIKMDLNGTMQWSQRYPDFGRVYAFVQTSDGGYALGSAKRTAIVKTDALGNTQWTQNYGGDQGWSMIKTSDEGFAISSTALVKTDALGKEQWSVSFDECLSSNNRAYSVIQTQDGGYAVAGDSSGAWLAKINLVPSVNPTAQTSPSPLPSSQSPTTIPTQTQVSPPTQSPSPKPSPSIPEFPIYAILLLLATATAGSLAYKKKRVYK
ncbi:MAG: hypothetical protein NWF00_10380 [Candidatus Bathyarchaeota archaeon]|nr:hypothetical protein [Candidatus Bathyarchaeota archaeon]